MNRCKQCNSKTANRVFCSNDCKFAWQSRDKPSKKWLEQKYLKEKMSAPDIAKIVNRNSKRVYEWIVEYGIPTRKRGHNYKETLIMGSGPNSAAYGRKHTEESKRKMSESSKGPAPWLRGPVHHLYGKRGPESPFWKGGVTPERQSLYRSRKWINVVKDVWARDDARCQVCNKRQDEDRDIQYDIHHIVPFADSKKLRCELSNLVLLCHSCHLWVHSNDNKENIFIVR